MLKAWRMVGHFVLAPSVAIGLAACDRTERSVSRPDTTVAPPVGAVEPPPAAGLAWDSTAGVVFLVREDSVTRAIYPLIRQLDSSVVLDEVLVRGLDAEGVTATGAAGVLRVEGFSPMDESCAVWPSVVVSSDAPREWTVAFQRGVAKPIALRSIESLPPPDSARLAAQLTRLAATLPNDTARAFRELPFTIRAAHSFTPTGGVEAVVAEIVRRVNIEANPREETLLLVAERDSGSTEWRVAYSERASGNEADVERALPLAAVKLGRAELATLVLERAGADWVAYALVQRRGDGEWRETWESAYSGC